MAVHAKHARLSNLTTPLTQWLPALFRTASSFQHSHHPKMISLHKLLIVSLIYATSHSLAQTSGNGSSSGSPPSIGSTSGDIPLANKRFTWPNLPNQADTGNGPRGTQQGFNICNSTTQNQDSMCQTTFLNSIQEFCIWGAPKPNSVVGDVEGEMVAYCTTKKFGTRLLPAGALTGVQVTRTPGYIQAVGFIQQSAINLQPNDSGGEEDPHGADQRGNPLGGLMYSSAFNTPGGPQYTQVIEWSYFVGGGIFCYKACDPAGPNAPQLCQHIYDRIGCTYNAPAHYETINGTFTSCQGENQLPAGTYVENGVTKTYTQPPESAGPITSIPYKAFIPAVSNCQTFNDTKALWPDLPQLAVVSNNSGTSNSSSSASTPNRSSTSSSNAAGNASSDASDVVLSSITMVFGLMMAVCLTL